MRQKPVLDVSALPTYGFGSVSPMWWGTLAYVALEGTGFALTIGAYLYLASQAQEWPISAPPPDLLPGTIVLILLIVSVYPNHLAAKWAKAEDLPRVRLMMVVMSVLGLAPLIVRGFEFSALNVMWDDNAYGSIVWFLLGLHTTHLLTDVGETLVLTVLMFTRHGHSGTRLSDVSDNAFYWNFVVLSWIPIYLILYWAPRL
jgi:heme/copper-type cytochrome/quinol oxidase subunit 3